MILRDNFLTIEDIEQEDNNLEQEVKKADRFNGVVFNSIFFGLWAILFIVALLEG